MILEFLKRTTTAIGLTALTATTTFAEDEPQAPVTAQEFIAACGEDSLEKVHRNISEVDPSRLQMKSMQSGNASFTLAFSPKTDGTAVVTTMISNTRENPDYGPVSFTVRVYDAESGKTAFLDTQDISLQTLFAGTSQGSDTLETDNLGVKTMENLKKRAATCAIDKFII